MGLGLLSTSPSNDFVSIMHSFCGIVYHVQISILIAVAVAVCLLRIFFRGKLRRKSRGRIGQKLCQSQHIAPITTATASFLPTTLASSIFRSSRITTPTQIGRDVLASIRTLYQMQHIPPQRKLMRQKPSLVIIHAEPPYGNLMLLPSIRIVRIVIVRWGLERVYQVRPAFWPDYQVGRVLGKRIIFGSANVVEMLIFVFVLSPRQALRGRGVVSIVLRRTRTGGMDVFQIFGAVAFAQVEHVGLDDIILIFGTVGGCPLAAAVTATVGSTTTIVCGNGSSEFIVFGRSSILTVGG
mmetsp:Transcript_7158/g.12643  ORF Transcript_7158/g.12643 Transcript_7158/m.12643 type:complete len:296 (+) Transcript_7158:124-1011(+)